MQVPCGDDFGRGVSGDLKDKQACHGKTSRHFPTAPQAAVSRATVNGRQRFTLDSAARCRFPCRFPRFSMACLRPIST